MLFSTPMGEAAQTESTAGMRSRLACRCSPLAVVSLESNSRCSPRCPPASISHRPDTHTAFTTSASPSRSSPPTSPFPLNTVPRRAVVSKEQRHRPRCG
ncbi:hypothetical protein B0H12DRAFT_1105982 [Mycena haematopus]|nr:hypothetical protein B0H12DRAFT_1105982 [Mycena haematopus]